MDDQQKTELQIKQEAESLIVGGFSNLSYHDDSIWGNYDVDHEGNSFLVDSQKYCYDAYAVSDVRTPEKNIEKEATVYQNQEFHSLGYRYQTQDYSQIPPNLHSQQYLGYGEESRMYYGHPNNSPDPKMSAHLGGYLPQGYKMQGNFMINF